MAIDDGERGAELEELLREAIRAGLIETHTALPGRIESFDDATLRATVVAEISRQTQGGETVQIPPIEDVPVVFPGAGGYTLTFPVAAGDKCLLVFSERDLAGWKMNGDELAPPSSRRHAYSDAVAIMGLRTPGVPMAPAVLGSGAVLRSDDNQVRVEIVKGSGVLIATNEDVTLNATKKVVLIAGSDATITATGALALESTGKISLTRGAGELLTILSTVLDLIGTSTAGGDPLSNAAAIAAQKALIDAMSA